MHGGTLVAQMADRGDHHHAGPVRPRTDPILRPGFVDRWSSKDPGRRTNSGRSGPGQRQARGRGNQHSFLWSSQHEEVLRF
ncbi:hypothetical protein GW17_00038572, partial [Ensete ventricosum]